MYETAESRNDFNEVKSGRDSLSSPVGKRAKAKKKEEAPKHAARVETSRPAGALPMATVEVRHDGRMIERAASGYSMGEVALAGLNFRIARSWGLRIDDRRRSTLVGNVASLKKWSSQAKKTREERVEGEVRKIEKAVEKEVRKAEHEVERGVHKAEREVEKVEKEVVEKVEAPVKKRAKKKTAKSKDSKS